MTSAQITDPPSASKAVLIERFLKASGVQGQIDSGAFLEKFAFGASPALAGKPDPAPYLLALQRLGVGARDAIAVEDSEVGRRSAEAAGLPVAFYDPKSVPQSLPPISKQIGSLRDLLDVIA
jgi:beta-phosphoglucomutase-like phosphatase (HAD superfamily)